MISYSDILLKNIWLFIILLVAFLLITLFFIYKQSKEKPVTGKEELIGVRGAARTVVDKNGGFIFVEGELWKAESPEEVIQPGEKVEVIDLNGLILKVKTLEDS